MTRAFGGGPLAILVLILLPALGANWFWTASYQDVQDRAEAETRRHMQDVLHRVVHNSLPEMRARDLVTHAVFLMGRGESFDLALTRSRARLGKGWDLMLFDSGGNPVPLEGHPVTKVTARRRLFEAIAKMQADKALPSNTEKKLSEQLLGDPAGIIVLAGSRGHFRRFGNQAVYSHGGRWTIDRAGHRYTLVALLKVGAFKGFELARDGVLQAAGLCRGVFHLALVGRPGSRSLKRLPADLVHAMAELPGGQGNLLTERHQAVVRLAHGAWRFVAWNRRGAGRPAGRDLGQLAIFIFASSLTLFLGSLLVFEKPQAISLRWVVPGLLLGVTVPILVFFSLAMGEQRRRLLDKEVYESHRRIEVHLRQIDQNFSLFLQRIARVHQRDLERFCATHAEADLRSFTQRDRRSSLYSAYLFDEQASLTRVLASATQNTVQDRKLAAETVKKLMGLVFGTMIFSDFEDPFFAHYIRNLGWFVESKLLNPMRFQLLDMRTDPSRPHGLTGVFLTHERDRLVKEYFRQVIRDPVAREGLSLAVVACDEGNLVESLPRSFMTWPEGTRLGEMVLREGQTVDAVLGSPSGRSLLVSCMQGRNLGGFLLVGGIPFAEVTRIDSRLRGWTIGTLALGVILALLSAWFLVNMILSRLQDIRQGIDQIVAHRSEVRLDTSGGDEFAELARGIEQAAVTLEEVYSSRPVQETLVRCDPPGGSEFLVAAGFDPGADPGGDSLDAFPVSGDRYLMAVGDVLGEGWQTALVVAAMRVAARLHLQRRPDLSVLQLLGILRTHYLGVRSVVKHMALFVALLDLRTGLMEWIGAGIAPPILVRDGVATFLPTRNPPLGAAVNRPFVTFSETIRPGDCLVLYTDGWIKTQSESGTPLGFDQFAAIVTRAVVGSTLPEGPAGEPPLAVGAPLQEGPDRVIAAVREGLARAGFTRSLGDDRSIFVLTRAASMPSGGGDPTGKPPAGDAFGRSTRQDQEPAGARPGVGSGGGKHA